MMKVRNLLLFLLICSTVSFLSAQARLTATSDSGGAYSVIAAANFGIEGPDDSSSACAGNGPGNHTGFGDHVTQTADAELGQNVFVFHSHIDEDNDRCIVFDRARMEIKGGPSGRTDEELEHDYGDTTYYRWQFRLAEDFIGASSFCHLFQNKAAGGDDSGFPVLTLTARATRLELRQSAGDGNPSGTLGTLASASLDQFRGKWVEVYMEQVHSNNGKLVVTITDVTTGLAILNYANEDVDLFRGDASSNVINRPKWGIYRAYNTAAGLKDEQVRFANFCASESSAEACPSVINFNNGAPAEVTGALPLSGAQSVPTYMPLLWNAVPGAMSYNVYLGTSPAPTLTTNVLTTSFAPALAPNTTYYFRIGSLNDAGETLSDVQQFTTLTNPDDGAWEVARVHARPELEAPQFFEFDTNLTGVEIDSTGRITTEAGNNAYCFLSGPKEGSNGNYRWRYRQEEGEEVTLVLR
ncbi:MAG: heparin lyase I family protein, partial [Bacteroidota bacterium]